MKLCTFFTGNLLKDAGLRDNDLNSIGISFPGFVASSQGYVTSENFPQWQNIPIQEMFQKQFNLPVTVDDCSRLMALAELWFGKGKDCRDFIVADLGFGIGCGIVIDWKIFKGSKGKSGEVGHTLVDINGPTCTCGSRGCIESFAAGWALSREAQNIMEQHPDSLLFETSGSSPDAVNYKEVVLAANLGDSYCIGLLKRAGEYIGIGLSNAISFFNPSRLIIGGRLIQDNSIMLEAITNTINIKCMKQILDDVEITVSDLGGGASALGAGISCILNEENTYLTTIQNKRF